MGRWRGRTKELRFLQEGWAGLFFPQGKELKILDIVLKIRLALKVAAKLLQTRDQNGGKFLQPKFTLREPPNILKW